MISELIGDLGRSVGLAGIMRVAGVLTRLVPIPQPTMLVGPGASGRLGQAIAGFSHHKVLLVTDHLIARLGLYQDLTHALTLGGTPFVVFAEIAQDFFSSRRHAGTSLAGADDGDPPHLREIDCLIVHH